MDAIVTFRTIGLQTPLIASFSPYRIFHLNRFGHFELKDRTPSPAGYEVMFNM